MGDVAGTQQELTLEEEMRYPNGFWRWHAENPHIYKAFRVMAIRMALMGRKRYSARTIIEVIRWNSEIKDSTVHFKINDHYTPGLARLFMRDYHNKWPKFFELR